MVNIDYVKCNGEESCPAKGICAEVCAVGAITMKDNFPVLDLEKCPDCGLCIMNCPNEAIYYF